ncbi:hypothetical protein ACPOLB_07040 [Rubrivivax sp. RP6-9]|uniref:hypothetical protein n=1 Tax=Rubrivivax sp. RP6-9 TaxID=3415750 RepID=UPI003CC50504
MPARRPHHHQAGGAGRAALVAVALAAVLAWWLAAPSAAPVPPRAMAAGDAAPLLQTTAGEVAALPAASTATAAALPAAAGLSPAQRQEQIALWRERLERAKTALANYQQAARYPDSSRPIEEHPDQVRPFEPIAEDRALRMPGGSVTPGVRLRTTQDRIFLAGLETARITVALVDADGRPQPLRVTRAMLHEVTEPGRTARTNEVAIDVNDRGSSGDLQAGDGVHSAVLQPGAQGFTDFAGTVRLTLHLDHAGQPGFLFFDLVYSPELAATWVPGVRDMAEGGDLRFVLQADVRLPGRYVVSGRIDDAAGQPVALALFNAELGGGRQAIVLPVAGRLLHDRQPAFPLRLRDVEAFLLKPDTFPDRVMLPRLAGVLHSSAVYTLDRFANAEPGGDQRARYLAELGKDVREAEQQLQQLGP